MYRYRLVALAGTFDQLHRGHEEFISRAFELGKRAVIGITSDKMAERKFKIENLELKVMNYDERKRELEDFLRRKKLLERTTIVKIEDVYGPAVRDSRIEALLVTRETINGGRLINKKRRQMGFLPLKLIVFPFVRADDGRKISSSRVRIGEIDRKGRSLGNLINLTDKNKLCLSEEIRWELKKPQGIFIEGNPKNYNKVVKKLKKMITAIHPVLISTVGDEVTRLCNKIGITPHLAIFDYKVKRKVKYRSLDELGFLLSNKTSSFAHKSQSCHLDYSQSQLVSFINSSSLAYPSAKHNLGIPRLRHRSFLNSQDFEIRCIRNPAGYITKTLIDTVRKAYKRYIQEGKRQLIKVIGEDDLSGIPAILLAPLGSIIIYGQPAYSESLAGETDGGIVVVEVTEEKKRDLIDKISNRSSVKKSAADEVNLPVHLI